MKLMWTATVFCLCLVWHTNDSHSSGKQLVQEYAARLCPFTDFCHTNATKNLGTRQNADDLCCKPCSCELNCWEKAACCIDMEEIVDKQPVWNCKKTVRQTKANDGGRQFGHNIEVRTYRIFDSCPDTKRSSLLDKKCKSEFAMSLDGMEQLVWVSDMETGIIYQNQYCAECHGVKHFIYWQIVTNCEESLATNFSTIFKDISSGTCLINNEVPISMRHTAENQICFLPNYDRCNQTGLWRDYNADLAFACNTFTSPVLQRAFTGHYWIYKNVFCYVCNGLDPINFQQFCPGQIDFGRGTHLGFSALIDFNTYMSLEEKYKAANRNTERCRRGEVFDIYMEICRPLVCPFGSIPLHGQCEELTVETDGLSVNVLYHYIVNATSEPNVLFAHAKGREALGEKILKRFQASSGLRKSKCPFCRLTVHAVINDNAQVPVFSSFYLHAVYYTNANCQLEKLYNAAIEFEEKNWKVDVKDTDYLVLRTELDAQTSAEYIMQNSVIIYHTETPTICLPVIFCPAEGYCPAIDLWYAEVITLEDVRMKGLLLAFFEVKEHTSGVMRVCLHEYYSFMSQKVSAASFAWNVIHNQYVVIPFTFHIVVWLHL